MTDPAERSEWFGGPVDGVVFALIMVVAAFLGRENPRFVYPEVLFCFLGLLAFNFINFSVLSRVLNEERRSMAAVASNILFLSLVVYFSGGAQSYFWVLYLLPVFNACLAFQARGVWTATAAVMALILAFHCDDFIRHRGAEVLEPLIKVAIIAASAVVVMRVAGRERAARLRLEEEQRRSARERAQTREQIQRMDRLAIMGTLTAGVAHELNTPLAAILGYTQMIELDSESSRVDARKLFSRIEDNVRRCKQIIQDMLSFSRQKKGQRKMCDVNALIRECVDIKEHDWLVDGVQAEFDFSPDMPLTLLSGSEFQQVIFNLLTNAHQAIRAAGRADGRIRLRTRYSQGWILVTVQDNGPGVPAAIADRIWDAFFTTKSEGEGTGLGLAICRQIVEAQGGALLLETPGDSGASFLIRLPIVAQEAALAKPRPASGPRRRAADKIFVADDDPQVLDLVGRLLAPYGLPVQSCADFDSVMGKLLRETPRMLICDLHMPGIGAFEFFLRLERDGLLDDMPIMIISGTPPGPNVEAFIRERGLTYLNKPFETEAFRAAMEKLLAGAGYPSKR